MTVKEVTSKIGALDQNQHTSASNPIGNMIKYESADPADLARRSRRSRGT